MAGTSLKQFLESKSKIDVFYEQLIALIEEASNPAFRSWDIEQSMFSECLWNNL
jgi:hypothetical protein